MHVPYLDMHVQVNMHQRVKHAGVIVTSANTRREVNPE